MNETNSIIKSVRLSPLRQFWLNIFVPICGIVFFHWTPGSVLFCFFIELINYWLCNTVLLLFYVKNEPTDKRIINALKFSFYFILSLVGYYYFIAYLSNTKDTSMNTNITYGQIIAMTILYWLQFAYYLRVEQPAGKISSAIINKEVSYRMTGIYLTIFCIICYIFVFWTNTNVMNYAMVFSMIFAKNLTDLVLIAVKMNRANK